MYFSIKKQWKVALPALKFICLTFLASLKCVCPWLHQVSLPPWEGAALYISLHRECLQTRDWKMKAWCNRDLRNIQGYLLSEGSCSVSLSCFLAPVLCHQGWGQLEKCGDFPLPLTALQPPSPSGWYEKLKCMLELKGLAAVLLLSLGHQAWLRHCYPWPGPIKGALGWGWFVLNHWVFSQSFSKSYATPRVGVLSRVAIGTGSSLRAA